MPSPIDVLNLACAAPERLFAEGCTLIVVACNTASTMVLRRIQEQWLPVRRRDGGPARSVIGVVVPTIEAGRDGVLPDRDMQTPARYFGSAANVWRT